MNPNTEARSASVPVFIMPCQGREPGKGSSPKKMRGTHFLGPSEQVRDCHAVKQCVALCYMQYDIILHFVPVFKPVFLLSVQISVGAA